LQELIRERSNVVKQGHVFVSALVVLSGVLAGMRSASPAHPRQKDRQLRYAVFYIRRQDLPVNLGPTGAWGYACRNMIVVKGTHPRTPAHEVLRKHDIITGANGGGFGKDEDPRIALGNAITESETSRRKGVLTLAILRDGAEQTVEIRLRVVGSYSPTWPFGCKKSQSILAEACRFVAERATPERGTTGHREFNALLLLASGDIGYLDIVRRTTYRLVDDPLTAGYQGWSRSFAGLLLGEYYLATGDPTVLPKLRHLAKATAQGQMRCGSWGHRMPWDGYGAVNQIGLMCFIALALFQEGGIEVDEAAMQRSTEFFLKFAGRGWVPYGDHRPWRGRSGNGKNGSAAVVFDLLGTHPEAVAEFSRSVAASYRCREIGHTGAFFSFVWGPPGAIRAPTAMFRQFADYQTWYYDLARTHDGGLVCQPNPENLSGRTPGSYTRWGPGWTTGGMATIYALPTRRLRILGGEKSIFAQRPPASLRQALVLFNEKKWRQVASLLKAYLKKPGGSPRERAYASGLLQAYKRLEESAAATMKAIDRNIQKGDFHLASEQLKALKRLLGEERPKMAEFRRALEREPATKEIEIAKEYYRALRGYKRHAREWRRMANVAKNSKGHYGKLAARALANAQPPPRPPKWETVLPSSAKTPQEWKYFQWGKPTDEADTSETAAAPVPKALTGWYEPAFDDSSWQSGPGPFRARKGKGTRWDKQKILLRKTFSLEDANYGPLSLVVECGPGTQVYLNGYRVVVIVSTPRRPDEPILLHDKAAELLKKGKNLIAVYSQKGRPAAIDVSLRAARAK